jgi:hypothetical protein
MSIQEDGKIIKQKNPKNNGAIGTICSKQVRSIKIVKNNLKMPKAFSLIKIF